MCSRYRRSKEERSSFRNSRTVTCLCIKVSKIFEKKQQQFFIPKCMNTGNSSYHLDGFVWGDVGWGYPPITGFRSFGLRENKFNHENGHAAKAYLELSLALLGFSCMTTWALCACFCQAAFPGLYFWVRG